MSVRGHSHDAVATLIGFDPDTVSLLVVDRDADDYFRRADVAVAGNMDQLYVERIAGPDTQPQGLSVRRPPPACSACTLKNTRLSSANILCRRNNEARAYENKINDPILGYLENSPQNIR